MSIEEIIAQVTKIILKHSKPERIWLYGSRASGEAKEYSDIDIAFDDKDCKADWQIEEEIEKLQTLIKIDVKNIAHTEERFRQRVLSTGRVLYSASKKLRFEDGLYNFQRALERFSEAIAQREELEQRGYGDIVLDLCTKRFEFTYEMSWKAIKRGLDYMGIEAAYPRICFKEAYAIGLITNQDVWIDMIEQRNLSSHVYNQDEVRGILAKLETYRDNFDELYQALMQKLEH
ncbi:HI0074 family nucleotidyltransferase substrate-binding subunit [Geobacter benzoatilyticus]|jgi:nucleotidyltransferase substrate binding protein (TIGR01987 family)|uniref:Nucleotidyltransferase substrate binding protein n=1 Tax=Geobacter benzoatilyticus TaxID=2815309 RepID=A0ABX7Q0C1_9BACT|nr:HI0074 family nucleotidyltransferase substrate-binding subunit [Geobacter benzoatilyticus]QSV44847.1 nucleotidyltransferase substrate binding protein [Geobacter benzoatilyticus]